MSERLSKINVYMDMDGVLSDFSSTSRSLHPEALPYHMTYAPNLTDNDRCIQDEIIERVVQNGSEFWRKLPWMPGGLELYRYVANRYPNFGIITAALKEDPIHSWRGKQEWLTEQLPAGLPKYLHALQAKQAVLHYPEAKGQINILIDDLQKNIKPWIAEGGIGILHKSTPETIAQLQAIEQTVS